MDPISNSSPFAILLRQRLAERAKLTAKNQAERRYGLGQVGQTPVSPLASLVAQKGPDDHETQRALVEQLLATEFGDQVLNEVRFQQIVEQVTRAMAGDPDLARQMAEVLRGLS